MFIFSLDKNDTNINTHITPASKLFERIKEDKRTREEVRMKEEERVVDK